MVFQKTLNWPLLSLSKDFPLIFHRQRRKKNWFYDVIFANFFHCWTFVSKRKCERFHFAHGYSDAETQRGLKCSQQNFLLQTLFSCEVFVLKGNRQVKCSPSFASFFTCTILFFFNVAKKTFVLKILKEIVFFTCLSSRCVLAPSVEIINVLLLFRCILSITNDSNLFDVQWSLDLDFFTWEEGNRCHFYARIDRMVCNLWCLNVVFVAFWLRSSNGFARSETRQLEVPCRSNLKFQN